jgi:hypothetical protein
MDETKQICPLLAIANHVGSHGFPEVYCQRERCAWWDGRDEACAVTCLAAQLRSAAMSLDIGR